LPRQAALLINGSESLDGQDGGLPLWLATVPSGAVRRLGGLTARFVAVSPDEERLAIVYGAPGEMRIGLARADGSEFHELMAPAGGWGASVAWAPDARRLRFAADGPAGREYEPWVWETSILGEKPRPLWPGRAGQWKPDGRQFIFGRPTRPVGWSRADLWTTRDGSWLPWSRATPVRLSFGPMSLSSPGFSRDGRLFAWGDLARGELLHYNAGTRRLESYLGGLSAHYADVSPDGHWVVFTTYPEGELWKARTDGSEKRQLSAPGVWATLPRWSPDGRAIAFVGHGPEEDYLNLRRVSADGRGEEVLTRPKRGANLWDVCWLPEGDALVFSHLENSRPGVFKLDLRTKQISLLPGAGNLMQSICSRQGDVLAWQETPEPTYRILRHGRSEWEDVGFHSLAYPNWTRDGEAIIGLNWEGQRVERLDLKTRRGTTVVDLAETSLVMSDYGSWMGLAADDSPVVLRDRGTRDLYALDWEAP